MRILYQIYYTKTLSPYKNICITLILFFSSDSIMTEPIFVEKLNLSFYRIAIFLYGEYSFRYKTICICGNQV